MASYYTSSGKSSPLSYLYFIAVSLILMPIVGLLYAFAIWHMPIIYVNFLLSACFGFLTGFLINKIVVRYGKVRSVGMAILFSFLAAVFGLYFSWVSWIDLVINAASDGETGSAVIVFSNVDVNHLLNLATNPSGLFSIIGGVNEIGTWGFKGTSISGGFLTTIWVLEFLIVLIVSILVGTGSASEPFCESTNQWFAKKDIPSLSYIYDVNSFVFSMENNNLEAMDHISTCLTAASDNHSNFTLYASELGERYLSVTNKTAKIGDDGKVSFDDALILKALCVSNELYEQILAKGEVAIK